jgi:2-polyprenyl-6-methoxyphenol hydroxylase-like FAD-dependent oxidoreductase
VSASTLGDPRVLVVGAGPVGLLLACELARHGGAVRVVDKLPGPTDESRAIVVHARSLEMLERVGVVEEVVATGVRMTGAEFHLDGGTEARIPLDTVDSPYPFSVSLPQTDTERILTQRLRSLGVEVDRGVEFVGFEQDDEGVEGVEATLRLPDGQDENARYAYVVGTDGSRSTVRHACGTRLEGSFKGERFLLADVEAEYDLDRSTMHSFFVPNEGPLLLFPMRGERTRVMAQLTDQALSKGQPTLSETQDIADRRARGIRLLRAHWLTVFEIHHAQVPSYRYGRVFLAGDAAHVHSPAGAQGMNTGMQDAFNLGWKLPIAARSEAAPGLLDSYHAERHPVAARVIEQTTRLTEFATLSRPYERVIRDHLIHLASGLAPLRREMAKRTEETDVGYRGSPIVEAGHDRRGPRPGDAAPDVPGVSARGSFRRSLYEGTEHTLLYIARTPGDLDGAYETVPASPRAASARRLVVAAEEVDESWVDSSIADPEGRIADRYGVGEHGEIFAIRPDGYIGMRTRLDDHNRLDDYFATLYRATT